MMVGEQPGDREDLAGRPLVGSAGRLLDGMLAEVGLERREIYLTNAVKHSGDGDVPPVGAAARAGTKARTHPRRVPRGPACDRRAFRESSLISMEVVATRGLREPAGTQLEPALCLRAVGGETSPRRTRDEGDGS
jgi:hypothetical protein